MQPIIEPIPSQQPLRLMLFDTPRTTCQVFYKLWQSHPELAWGRFYHGFNGYQHDTGDKAREKHWLRPYQEGEDANRLYPPALELAQKNFIDAIESSEKDGEVFFGKEPILFLLKQDLLLKTLRRHDRDTVFPLIKENPTYISDDIIKTLTPFFVIRHP